MSGLRSVAAVAAALLAGCGSGAVHHAPSSGAAAPPVMARMARARCGGPPLRVRFYDVGQALSVLLELSDGRRVLVDTGESARRPGCGEACQRWSAHLLAELDRDLGGRGLDAVWITHQHSDHLGGVPAVLAEHGARLYVDNGTATGKPMVRAARSAARRAGAPLRVVDPSHPHTPLRGSSGLRLRALVPPAWPSDCEHHPNDCSIGLRIDYCDSSLLLEGDAERAEEAVLDPGGPIDLLQVGHHGSETSSSAPWLRKLRPHYAVISAARRGEGTNRDYCHPRAGAVARLSEALGGGRRPLRAFAGPRCRGAAASDWIDAPASDRLWATPRDGDVVLVTRGDGVFTRAPAAQR